jgi:hypothetical protein
VTYNGIVHLVRSVTEGAEMVLPNEAMIGAEFLWFACNSDEGICGYRDDPSKNVTCLLCLMRMLS